MDSKRSVGDPPTAILRGRKGGRVALPPLKNHVPRKERGRPAHSHPRVAAKEGGSLPFPRTREK
jgi:hypothetical protein